MAKKNNVKDIFEGIKYVDKLLNEAAGIEETSESSFEEKLNSKLVETSDLDSEKNSETIEEYNYDYNYNYNYDNPENFLDENEEESLEEIKDLKEEEEEEDLIDSLDLDLDLIGDEEAKKEFEKDFGSEFGTFGDEEEFELSDMEDDFDILNDSELMEALFENEDMEEPAPVDVEAGSGESPEDTGVPIEGEIGEEMPIMPDMSADMEADLATEPSGTEEIETDVKTTPISQPEDIDMLIASILPEGEETLTENELKDLGFEDLEETDITDKVKMESVVKETADRALERVKLGDKDITDKVGDAIDSKKYFHKGKGKHISPEDNEFEKLGDEDIDGSTVADEAPKKITQPKFTAIQKESEQKTKALYALAEQVVDLQDEVAKLKLENYKLSKVNSILTLLPELAQPTREKLVEKFDKCNSFGEAKRLFNEIASMVKDYKKGSLNEAIIKNNKAAKFVTPESETSTERQELDEAQARKNMLMGIPGYEDQYFSR
jgi:hypothetical protein